MDSLRIEDQDKNVAYIFESSEWFSTTSNDGRTSRFLMTKQVSSLDSDSETYSSSDSSVSIKAASTQASENSLVIRNNTKKSPANTSRHLTKSVLSDRSSASRLSSVRSSTPTTNAATAAAESRTRSRSSSTSTEKDDDDEEEEDNSRKPPSRTATRQSMASSVRFEGEQAASQKFAFSFTNSNDNLNIQPQPHANLNIFEAVEQNRLDIVKQKLQMAPLDICKQDLSGRSLMIIACERGHENIVKYLADNSDSLLSMDTPLGLFPVHVCAQNNQLECMTILYEFGASLQSKTNEGNTPLHLAALK